MNQTQRAGKTPQDTPGFSCSCNSGESFSRASLCQLLLHCVKASAWISQGRASAGSRIHPPAPGAAGNTNPARPPPQQFGQRGRSGAQPGRCCRVSPAAAPPGLAQSPAELHRDGNNRGSRDQPGNGGRREGRAGAALGALLWSSPGCTGSFASRNRDGCKGLREGGGGQQEKVMEEEVKLKS